MLLAGLLIFSVGSASAFPLWNGYYQSAGTQFEDDNLDFFTDNDNDGLISVGDVLTSVIEFGNAVHLNEFGLGIETVALDGTVDDLVALGRPLDAPL